MENYRSAQLFARICLLSLIVVFTQPNLLRAQTPEKDADAVFIRKIYNQALTDGCCYPWLEHLSLRIGHRISGSMGAEKAVQWTRTMLDTLGLDTVWLQPCMVPRWVRGDAEQVRVSGSKKSGTFNLNALALGGSGGTPAGGISGGGPEVKRWEELG